MNLYWHKYSSINVYQQFILIKKWISQSPSSKYVLQISFRLNRLASFSYMLRLRVARMTTINVKCDDVWLMDGLKNLSAFKLSIWTIQCFLNTTKLTHFQRCSVISLRFPTMNWQLCLVWYLFIFTHHLIRQKESHVKNGSERVHTFFHDKHRPSLSNGSESVNSGYFERASCSAKQVKLISSKYFPLTFELC